MTFGPLTDRGPEVIDRGEEYVTGMEDRDRGDENNGGRGGVCVIERVFDRKIEEPLGVADLDIV